MLVKCHSLFGEAVAEFPQTTDDVSLAALLPAHLSVREVAGEQSVKLIWDQAKLFVEELELLDSTKDNDYEVLFLTISHF